MQQREPRIIAEPPVLLDETSTHPSDPHRSTASLASSRPLSGFVYQLFFACGPAFSPSINLSSFSSLRLLQVNGLHAHRKANTF
ncbi:hypothetical protein NXS19_012247 [Fusarium pseudograminearum]|nr:hypothetical protein FPSE5266_20100 [Fusarium pseudograminearum]UZP44435.1 hypothetical protein NXS19_012247 [Fusarium pseudograminearum]